MQLGVYHDQQGNGGPVLNKYPYTTWYNRWRLIPADARLVKLVCDNLCTKTDSYIENAFLNGVAAFETRFDIDFRIMSISRESFSNGNSCPYTEDNVGCDSNCGTETSCYSNHHKNAPKLMGTTSSTSYHTYRFVGHGLCFYDDEKKSHDDYYGFGEVDGTLAITSDYTTPYLARTIQHELTHNLGASHKTCTETGCVLNGSNFNGWCKQCENTINGI